jgi:hypothetical protein
MNKIKTKQMPKLLGGLALALAAMAASAPLGAQETWSKYNYGLQVGALMPSGSMTNYAQTGFGVAGYAEKVWSNAWAIRGRLEYTSFGEKEIVPGVNAKLSQTGVMLDAIYYMGLKDVLYPFAGIGYFGRSLDVKVAGGQDLTANMDSELAFCFGLGWNFTSHLGLELKYTTCENPWFQASILYRF